MTWVWECGVYNRLGDVVAKVVDAVGGSSGSGHAARQAHHVDELPGDVSRERRHLETVRDLGQILSEKGRRATRKRK